MESRTARGTPLNRSVYSLVTPAGETIIIELKSKGESDPCVQFAGHIIPRVAFVRMLDAPSRVFASGAIRSTVASVRESAIWQELEHGIRSFDERTRREWT